MSDYSNASIGQIPNIGYCRNAYMCDESERERTVQIHDAQWVALGVQLAPFDPTDVYRKAVFPPGWTYVPNPNDTFKRSGWYVDSTGVKRVDVFAKDSRYQVGIRVEFLQFQAAV